MTAHASLTSPAFTTCTPRLSVLIPFYRESPLALLEALSTRTPEAVEIILLDDGSAQADLTTEVSAFIARSPLACELITLSGNEGRACGRNRLIAAARAGHLLFLDADMLPDRSDFLDRWLEVAASDPAVVFGGFTLDQAPRDPAFAVHTAMAARGDCLGAAERSKAPEKYVFTSNLLVRGSVFAEEDFDRAFTGWGWEDVEWAMRVSQRFPITHIDNTATHMGLDTVDTLIRKFDQSGPNFARVVARHTDRIRTWPSYSYALRLKALPLRGVLRAALKAVARASFLPVRLRALSLRLYRVSLYAEVV